MDAGRYGGQSGTCFTLPFVPPFSRNVLLCMRSGLATPPKKKLPVGTEVSVEFVLPCPLSLLPAVMFFLFFLKKRV